MVRTLGRWAIKGTGVAVSGGIGVVVGGLMGMNDAHRNGGGLMRQLAGGTLGATIGGPVVALQMARGLSPRINRAVTTCSSPFRR